MPLRTATARSRRRPWAARALSLVALAALAAGSPAAAAELDRFESEHYLVHTDLPKKAAAFFAEHMDRVHAAYRERFADIGRGGHGRMSLYLLGTKDTYARLLAERGIDAAGSGGMFFTGPEGSGLATYVADRPRRETLSVLQHEGFHQFAHARLGPDLPTWANEGVAQYFEDGLMVGSDLETGHRSPYRLETIQDALERGREFPIKRILSIANADWRRRMGREGGRSAVLYAQAWSMAYFLIHGRDGRYRDAFLRFLRLSGSGRPQIAAFEEAFETRSTRGFARQWRAFVRGLEADAVMLAMQRLRFLGKGIRTVVEEIDHVPRSLAELRHRLQKLRFRTIYTLPGLEITLRARDNALYGYPVGGRREAFRWIDRDGLPRLTAPGLSPQPWLTWGKDYRGNTVPVLRVSR